MEGTQTILEPPEDVSVSAKATGKKPQVFSFGAYALQAVRKAHEADKSYWSAGPRDEPGYASQQTLYEDLGVELLDHSFEGFNTCIFACESLLAIPFAAETHQMVRRAGRQWGWMRLS